MAAAGLGPVLDRWGLDALFYAFAALTTVYIPTIALFPVVAPSSVDDGGSRTRRTRGSINEGRGQDDGDRDMDRDREIYRDRSDVVGSGCYDTSLLEDDEPLPSEVKVLIAGLLKKNIRDQIGTVKHATKRPRRRQQQQPSSASVQQQQQQPRVTSVGGLFKFLFSNSKLFFSMLVLMGTCKARNNTHSWPLLTRICARVHTLATRLRSGRAETPGGVFSCREWYYLLAGVLDASSLSTLADMRVLGFCRRRSTPSCSSTCRHPR